MEKFPKVFIVILNYNGKTCLPNTLRGVFRLPYPEMEVVLVDNGSQDGSLESAHSGFPRISLIRNEHNIGFAAGMNVGIKYALERGAKYILLLNYDVEINNDFLTPLVEKMEENKKIGLASPVIFGKNGQVWFSGGKIEWWRMRAVHDFEKLKEDNFNAAYLSGCALLVRAEVFKKTGLLDEDYFLYYEDADFSLKTKKVGYKLLVSPESKLIHLERSENDSKQKTYWLVLSALIFFKRNAPFFWRPWLLVFFLARRLKNWRDLKKAPQESLAQTVQKAYQDFRYVK